MTFLKKFGLEVLKIVQIVLGLAPVVSQAIPSAGGYVTTVKDTLAKIADLVAIVESAFAAVSDPSAKTGPQKLQAVTPLVAQAILESSLLAGHKIANATLFEQAAKEIAGGVADLLNSLDQSGVTTTIPQKNI